MTVSADDLKLLLLDMIATKRCADKGMMLRLGEPDWKEFRLMARQHRLEPLLHYCSQRTGDDWPVPPTMRKRWARAYHKSACRALSIEHVTTFIAARFDAAQIPYAALKGAWLAAHAYEHPALRPLRDIDIIVPRARACEAFSTLLAAGFVRRSMHEPTLEFAMAHGKHLPGLLHTSTRIGIEIHHRLLSPTSGHADKALTAEDVLARRCLANGIFYLSPTDTLLHLIVHAVHEHNFCNGPLILSDIARLLQAAAVDWNHLWCMSEIAGWKNGCRLIFALVEHYHGNCGIVWPENTRHLPEDIMAMAALMMLQDHDQRGKVELMARLGTAGNLSAKLRLAASRVWPQRHALAAFAGLPVESRRLWLSYPGWLGTRIIFMLGSLFTPNLRAELPRSRYLRLWLRT